MPMYGVYKKNVLRRQGVMKVKRNETLGICIEYVIKFGHRRNNDADKFREYLEQNEMSEGTIEEYTRNVNRFCRWARENGKPINILRKEEMKKTMLEYKKMLQETKLAATSINAKLAALNKYLTFRGMNFTIKYLRVQKRIFKETNRELNKGEYEKLIETARNNGKERIAIVMETLGATGIRVSELKYITIEALEQTTIEINMKNKVRIIVIPERMKEKLRKYAYENNISSGEIFITSAGKSLSRNQIWKEMKSLSEKAKITSSKVYPHNIRALFARLYYEESKDIVRLGDILGHSSINTTRIYLKVSLNEYQKQMDRMNVVA